VRRGSSWVRVGVQQESVPQDLSRLGSCFLSCSRAIPVSIIASYGNSNARSWLHLIRNRGFVLGILLCLSQDSLSITATERGGSRLFAMIRCAAVGCYFLQPAGTLPILFASTTAWVAHACCSFVAGQFVVPCVLCPRR